MRLLRRLQGGLRALTAPAEDPRQTFASAYERQRELLAQVEHARVAIATSKQQLEAKTSEVREQLPSLEDQARRALIAGREDVARLALQRRQAASMELQALEEQVRELQQEEPRLALVEQRLAAQIEAFRARQAVIAARYSAAEAQVRANEQLTGVSDEVGGLGFALEQARQQAEDMQARAAAIDRLVESGLLDVTGLPAGEAMDRRLAQAGDVQTVEDQLAALKGQLGLGGSPPS